MDQFRLLRVTLWVFLAGLPAVAGAETGMGLMQDRDALTMRRVDLKDGEIIHTSPTFGTNATHGRFSPDGENLAYVDEGGEVFVCDLDGNTLRHFSAFSGGSLSWTPSGIWVGSAGRAELYNANSGDFIRAIEPSGHPDPEKVKFRVMAHSETSYSALDHPPPVAKVVLVDSGNVVFDLGSGCSVGPSPDGNLFTHNLWEDGMEHQTMKIQDRSGAVVHYFYMFDIIPYPANETDRWSWNSQGWSSNSQDVILIPAGRGFPQMDDSRMPSIYNLSTGESYCLHSDCYAWNVHWQITDYFQGKVGVEIPEVAIERFDASAESIRLGESSDLSWTVINADEVLLDGEVVAATGSRTVSPTETTTYTLEARGEGGPKTRSVTVTVTDNKAPEVDAGPNVSGAVSVAIIVNASVSDDGEPSGTLNIAWTQISGPGTVAFSSPSDEDTSVTCPQAGTYVIRLTASDGELETFDEIEVEAVEEPEKSIQILAPLAGDVWEVGEDRAVEWTTVGIADVVIYYSVNDGETWTPLTTSIDHQSPDWGHLAWVVPDEPSTECWVRMEEYLSDDYTLSGPFEIRALDIPDPDEEDEIVIVGSCASGGSPRSAPPGLLLLLLVFLRRTLPPRRR